MDARVVGAGLALLAGSAVLHGVREASLGAGGRCCARGDVGNFVSNIVSCSKICAKAIAVTGGLVIMELSGYL